MLKLGCVVRKSLEFVLNRPHMGTTLASLAAPPPLQACYRTFRILCIKYVGAAVLDGRPGKRR
jgi:hypothetical protein